MFYRLSACLYPSVLCCRVVAASVYCGSGISFSRSLPSHLFSSSILIAPSPHILLRGTAASKAPMLHCVKLTSVVRDWVPSNQSGPWRSGRSFLTGVLLQASVCGIWRWLRGRMPKALGPSILSKSTNSRRAAQGPTSYLTDVTHVVDINITSSAWSATQNYTSQNTEFSVSAQLSFVCFSTPRPSQPAPWNSIDQTVRTDKESNAST
jgi:hypothetical protein